MGRKAELAVVRWKGGHLREAGLTILDDNNLLGTCRGSTLGQDQLPGR